LDFVVRQVSDSKEEPRSKSSKTARYIPPHVDICPATFFPTATVLPDIHKALLLHPILKLARWHEITTTMLYSILQSLLQSEQVAGLKAGPFHLRYL
jgi:hypothetical protein